jgi:hypothetical protein
MMVYSHVCYIGASHATCSVVEKHTYGTHLWRAAIFLTGSLIGTLIRTSTYSVQEEKTQLGTNK